MQDPEHFHGFTADPVGDEEGRIRDDQFPRPGYAARASGIRKQRQLSHSPQDESDLPLRGCWIVTRDVVAR